MTYGTVLHPLPCLKPEMWGGFQGQLEQPEGSVQWGCRGGQERLSGEREELV